MNDFKNQSPWGTPPGGGGNGDGFRRGPTPPNVDEIIRKIQDRIKKFFPGGRASGDRRPGGDRFWTKSPPRAPFSPPQAPPNAFLRF